MPNYNYTPAQIQERVHSGKDKDRARTADQLAAKATQPPHEDDAAALAQLQQLSGDDSTGGWGTNDARNYGRMRLAEITGQPATYSEARDGGGFQGALGSVLKTAAPFAGLIPGVGPLLGAGLAAGGSALGGALHRDKFNLLQTALAGASGYMGGKANPFGSHIPAAPDISGMGDATYSLGGGAGGGVPPLTPGSSGGGGGGLWDKVTGGFKTADGGWDVNKILGTVGTIGGGIQAANTQNQANEQREGAIQGATADYASKAPLRAAGQAGLLSLNSIKRPDLSSMFADPGNPWYRKPQPLGAGY